MVNMGLNFRLPRQNDLKAWKRLQGMHRVGHCFYIDGLRASRGIPMTRTSYRDYLAAKKKEYEEQLVHVRVCQCPHTAKGRSESIRYWQNKIEVVTREQMSLK